MGCVNSVRRLAGSLAPATVPPSRRFTRHPIIHPENPLNSRHSHFPCFKDDSLSLLSSGGCVLIMGDRDLYHLLPASAQVLTNTDLLHGIFTFIPRSSPLRHSYLLGCTTVCRTFHAPAIRVLWRTLETLVTLWHLLAPSNVTYPFGYTYSGGRDKILLDYLYEVSTFFSTALCLAHDITGQFRAVIPRSNTMGPLSLACRPRP